MRSQTPKVLNGTVEIRKWIISSHVIYNGCNYSSMSGLRKSMLVKPSLFVLAEVSTDRKQLGRRLPSGYQQEVSNLPSTSSNTPPHVRRNDRTHQSWKYKPVQRPFLFLSVKSSQYDRKCHVLVRDGHRSTANLLSFIEFYTSKLRPLRASCWCFAMTSACKYPQLTRTKSWACSKLVCGQIVLGCTFADKSGRDPCEILPDACFLRGTASSKYCPP